MEKKTGRKTTYGDEQRAERDGNEEQKKRLLLKNNKTFL